MGPNKGISKNSITSEGIRKGKAPLEVSDLSQEFNCPFPLKHKAEGEKYLKIKRKSLTSIQYFEEELLARWNLWNHLKDDIEILSFTKIAFNRLGCYEELVHEFFTTIEKDSSIEGSTSTRFGDEYTVNRDEFCEIFGFDRHRIDSWPGNVNQKDVWGQLTNSDATTFNISNLSARKIVHPVHAFLHKFICYGITGKAESDKVNKGELLIFWCLLNGRTCGVSGQVFKSLTSVHLDNTQPIGFGHFVTGFAEYFKVNNCILETYVYHPPTNFSHEFLRRAKIINSYGEVIICGRISCSTNAAGTTETHAENEPEREGSANPGEATNWSILLTRLDSLQQSHIVMRELMDRQYREQLAHNRKVECFMRQFAASQGFSFDSPPHD